MKSEIIHAVGIICIVIASFAFASAGSDDKKGEHVSVNRDSSVHNLPCNWEGWQSCFPEPKCRRAGCDRYDQILYFKCGNGVVTEVKMDMACVACKPPVWP